MPATRLNCLLTLLALLVTPAGFAAEKADAAKGKIVFERLCTACHAVAMDDSGPTMGPNLSGLIGRAAGSEPKFEMYTTELKTSGLKWSAKTLDEFLSNPIAKVPGTAMPLMLEDSKDRADVIAYIASLKQGTLPSR